MKKQIEEVQQYFKSKLLTGSFQVLDVNQNYIKVNVEGYVFMIWVGDTGNPIYCKPWTSLGYSFMVLPDFTEDESIILYNYCSKIIAENAERIRTEKIAKLEDELNKLKTI